jgi:hypothetical protein
VRNVLSTVRPGSIVVMHVTEANAQFTDEALGPILDGLAAAGLRPVPLSELDGADAGPLTGWRTGHLPTVRAPDRTAAGTVKRNATRGVLDGMTRPRRPDPRMVVGTLAFTLLAVYLVADGTTGTGTDLRLLDHRPVHRRRRRRGLAGAARKPGITKAERRLWRTLAAQCAVMVVGDITQAVLVWTASGPPPGTPGPVTDLSNLAGTIPG